MKKYIWYLLKSLFKPFLLSLCSITAIIWITRSIKYLEYITEYGVNFSMFITLIVLVLPSLLTIIIPISLIITNIMTYNKLIKNNEIVILQNCGIRNKSILLPSFLLSLIACIFVLGLTFYSIPNAEKNFEKSKEYIKNDITNVIMNKDSFNSMRNITIYAKNKVNNTLEGLLIYIKNDTTYNLITAENGEIENNVLKLTNGNIQESKYNDKTTKKIVFFEQYNINIGDYYDKKEEDNFVDMELLNIKELLKEKDKYAFNKLKYYAEVNKRIVSGIACITISLISSFFMLSIPFSRSESKLSTIIDFFVSLGVFGGILYLLKISEKNVIGIYLSVIMTIIPLILIIFKLREKKYV